jgi:hypothetical protein
VYITWETIITAGAVLGALGAIIGLFLRIHKWYLEQQKQSEEIKELKYENRLHMEAISACLDGLMQLGVNHTVPAAKKKLDEYLNKQAHI